MSFLAGALEIDVGDIALEGDVGDLGGERRVGGALAGLERFRPHEEDGVVAGLQALRIAAAQSAEGGLDHGADLSALMTLPAKGLFSPTKEATKAVSGSS